jgi:hypothetical protein
MANQVLGAVGTVQDEELRIARDGAIPEDSCPADTTISVPKRRASHSGANLGPDRGHGLLLRLPAQAVLELTQEASRCASQPS